MNTLYVGWEIDGMSNMEVLQLLNDLVGSELGIDDEVVGKVTAVLQVINIRPEYLVTKLEFEIGEDEKEDTLKRLFENLEKD